MAVSGTLPKDGEPTVSSTVHVKLSNESVAINLYFTPLSENIWRVEGESINGDILVTGPSTLLTFGADDVQRADQLLSIQPASNDNDVAHSVVNIIFEKTSLNTADIFDIQNREQSREVIQCVVQGRPDTDHEVTGGKVNALTEGLTNVEQGYLLEAN
jgi:hypothetical protein